MEIAIKQSELAKLISGHLSDMILIFDDDYEIIEINVHQVILYVSLPYFKTLIDTQLGSNGSSKKVTVKVRNSQVAKDIIQIIYQGTNGFQDKFNSLVYLLDFYIVCDFFGLEVNQNLVDKILGLKIDHEVFDLYLDVVEMIGFTNQSVKVIIDNIPIGYDRKKLPESVLTLAKNMFYDTVVIKYNGIYKLDKETDMCDLVMSIGVDCVCKIDECRIFISHRYQIWIVNIETCEITSVINVNRNIYEMYYSRIHNRLFFSTSNQIISLDVETKKTNVIASDSLSMKISPDGSQLVCYRMGCHPIILVDTDKLSVKKITCLNNYLYRLYYINNSSVAICRLNTIGIYDNKTFELVKTINYKHKIDFANISISCDKYFLTFFDKDIFDIDIYVMNKGENIDIYDMNKGECIVTKKFLSSKNRLFICPDMLSAVLCDERNLSICDFPSLENEIDKSIQIDTYCNILSVLFFQNGLYEKWLNE